VELNLLLDSDRESSGLNKITGAARASGHPETFTVWTIGSHRSVPTWSRLIRMMSGCSRPGSLIGDMTTAEFRTSFGLT
jgi:hypothetical protein